MRPGAARGALLLLLVLALGAAGAVRAERPPLAVGLAGQGASWRGISDDEAAGAQGLGMLYPAPNAGGLLAAILTHALIVDSQRSAERSAAQARADLVLTPHAATIGTLAGDALAEGALRGLPNATREAARGLVVQMQPRFALAPDARTLVLDNVLRVHDVDTPAVARFENTVRVVAAPRTEADPQAAWAADDGRALRDESLAMLAHSLDIALAPLPAAEPQAFRTQRYRFGLAQKMERGQPVAGACQRVVLRTLRDWLMSVPLATPEGTPPCAAPYALGPPG